MTDINRITELAKQISDRKTAKEASLQSKDSRARGYSSWGLKPFLNDANFSKVFSLMEELHDQEIRELEEEIKKCITNDQTT